MGKNKKILVADNSPLYRNGVKIAFASDQEIFALYEADSCDAVMAQVKQHPDLDLIILDVALLNPDTDCPLKKLISCHLIPVLLLCSGASSKVISNACSLGIKNIASKRESLCDLNSGIQKVLGGENCWPELGITMDVNQSLIRKDTILERMNELTSRQKIVLDYLSLGMMNKQISYLLGIGENTVKSHVSNIFRTLQVRNRTQLVVALQNHAAAKVN